MKKILALVMALCMLLACTAVAEEEPTYTYNTYMAEFPTVWSPFQMQTATDSELSNYLTDGFYTFEFNDTYDGYVIVPAMALDFPVDVTADYVGEQWGITEGETARAWKITLRDDLAWQDGTPITAQDFVKSVEYLLNPAAANYRADSYYSGTLVIANAEAYVKQGSTLMVNYTTDGMDTIIKGEDGVYTTANGDVLYISLNDTDAKYCSGYSLTQLASMGYVQPEVLAGLQALADENGYVPFTDESREILFQFTNSDNWGNEPADTLPCYAYYSKTYEAVDMAEVGFLATGDHEITIVLAKPLEGFYLHYNLTSSYLVNIPLYESLIVENGGVFTNAYGTSLETSFSYGPWMLVKYQSDKEIELVKNPYWYGYSLPENEGLYQTTCIHYDWIEEPETAYQQFFAGKLDAKGLDKDHIDDYLTSDYTYLSEGDSVFAMVFNPDMDALVANQAAAGPNINKTILTVKEFRMAMSFAMDRQAFCLATSPMNAPAFALYSGQIVADPDAGLFYRTTDEAKNVIVNFWGLADEIGEGKLYADVDEAIDSLTGYNLAMAREYFDKAYDIAIETGLMDEDDVILIIVGTPNNTAAFYNAGYDFIVNNYTEAVVGTKLEGKLTFTRDATLGNGFSDALRNNTVDMLFGVGWTGSTFDPYGLFEVYVNPNYQYDSSWDAEANFATITLDGVNYTASVYDWTYSMMGVPVTAKLDDGTEVTLDVAVTNNNMQILAALENIILQNYNFIPLMGDSSAALKGMQIEYFLEDEVFPMGRGGIKYMTYNYTDAEWDAFVLEQGGQLNYR